MRQAGQTEDEGETAVVVDRLARAVREQLGLGRLLPLGGPGDGAWLTERAADRVLRRAAAAVPDARLATLRIGLADPAAVARPEVPPPPSALPPGRLRIEATCAAAATREPLPLVADALRTALAGAAGDRLGLLIEAVDVRVTALLDEPVSADAAEVPPAPEGGAAEEPDRMDGRAEEGAEDRLESRTDDGPQGPDLPPGAVAAAAAAHAVPGVAALTSALGGSRQPVRIEDRATPDGAPAGRHVQVQVAVAPGHRALDVACAVRAAVARTVSAPVTVAVLVTDVRLP
ncbi:nucleopolyhedrovirus P10 family protein [Streptomyces sp. XD-27]|uniref:nucleopolyhedrovirus P10 family protein n=1 Tax=Streptomyces sp. XD-27 TaxID=3062779 RepID=UPI0026F43D9E|nr:nucleopolyhedrovirus P10 family protein [Streptomyces sp. XD-27]WKX69670.1 nucleopolyhedrovirus P10 family protein [Streptomyces sp. XD-27]